jgi:hypothetical protein
MIRSYDDLSEQPVIARSATSAPATKPERPRPALRPDTQDNLDNERRDGAVADVDPPQFDLLVLVKAWKIGFWDCIEFGSFLFNFYLLTFSLDNNR